MTYPRKPSLHLRLLAFALLGVVLGCANAAFNHAYREVIEREVDGYRHQGSVDELRRDSEAYLATLDYVPAPARTRTKVETEWRSIDFGTRRSVRVEFGQHPKGLLARVFVVQQELSPPRWSGASHERAREFERALHEQLIRDPAKRGEPDGFVYELDVEALWEAATREAFMGPGSYSFGLGTPPIDAVASSEWHEDAEQSERKRLEIRIHRHAAKRYSIEAHERVERAVGEREWQTISDARDIDLELGLMRHRDPLGVEKIEHEAQTAGDAAYRDAIDHGAIACQCEM